MIAIGAVAIFKIAKLFPDRDIARIRRDAGLLSAGGRVLVDHPHAASGDGPDEAFGA